jgi:hypothetical protein
MATAWIQVFILTFAECVAPAGKTVCQEQQFELQFSSRSDCEYALFQLITTKDQSDRIIVNRQKSVCVPSAIESEIYDSLEAINEANKDTPDWRVPGENEAEQMITDRAHRERLETLMSCEETAYIAPCKIGGIIVEDATGSGVDVWKSD